MDQEHDQDPEQEKNRNAPWFLLLFPAAGPDKA
jgi:hypothetical protein